ncbi:MAG: DUF2237 domain-containing protein [Bryobacterales bacterium]|jgi:hypothetical protein|nr:DUF2237 domain-containing protein [Bryobacterales bacterium]
MNPDVNHLPTNGHARARNVMGGNLLTCCTSPMTGFFRNGKCDTNEEDAGMHVVCAILTDEFLEYSKAQGNDLITPRPQWGFPGLKAGDKWCLCAARWKEAYEAGVAPKVLLEATHQNALQVVPLDALKRYAALSDEPVEPSA